VAVHAIPRQKKRQVLKCPWSCVVSVLVTVFLLFSLAFAPPLFLFHLYTEIA
jgi:hypothetical protein